RDRRPNRTRRTERTLNRARRPADRRALPPSASRSPAHSMANPVFAAVPQRQSDSTLTQVHSARLSEGEQEGDQSHTPGLESLRQNVHSNEARNTHGPAEHSRARHRRSLRTRPSHHRTSPG